MITLPSAFPLNRGITCPITLPISFAPPCDRLAHGGANLFGINRRRQKLLEHFDLGQLGVDQILATPRTVLLDRLAANLDALADHLERLFVGGGPPKLDLAILEIGDDGAEDEGTILLLALASRVQCGPQDSATLGPGDTRATAVLADGGVHFPLPLFAWLFEVAVLTKIGEDSRLLALLLEPLERPLEAFVIVDDDFRHFLTHPSRPGWA